MNNIIVYNKMTWNNTMKWNNTKMDRQLSNKE